MEYFTIPGINCEENLGKKFQGIVKKMIVAFVCYAMRIYDIYRFITYIFRNLAVEILSWNPINRIRIFVSDRKNLSEMYGWIHEWEYSIRKHKHIEGEGKRGQMKGIKRKGEKGGGFVKVSGTTVAEWTKVHRSCMKIDLHGLNDRDRWPLSMDACAIFPKKEEMDRALKKGRVLKLIDRKLAVFRIFTDLSLKNV